MYKFAIVLAGGLGTKFWPKSTESSPKQFTHMVGEGTCIQNTYERLKNYFPKEHIYFVTSYDHRSIIKQQLPDVADSNIIFEPFGRNTSPATALAVRYLLHRGADPESLFAVFPSDHIISNAGEFYNSLDIAFEAAEKLSSIVTIGIKPTRAETKFGYIQVQLSHPKANINGNSVFDCMTFAEKPDAGTAQRFLESGDFLWNSGIFVWKIPTFQNALANYLPEYAEKFSDLDSIFGIPNYVESLKLLYKQINSISLDYGILEKATNVHCVKSSFSWSDLGNWDELHRIQMKDANNNVIEGDVVSIDNKNCFINSNGKLIALIGLEDLIVVDSGDAILICKRGESEKVQDIVDFLRRNHIHNYL